MTTRIYLPTTLAGLAVLARDGALPPSPDVVVAPDDDEETEYAALMTAADLAPGRPRVVVVAEVEDVDGPVPLATVQAIHADDEDATGTDPDEDLGWYAVSELEVLLARR